MRDKEWPLPQRQPPTVIGDKLIVGWAGKDWEYEVESPGSLFALNARTGELEWEFKPIPDEEAGKTGTANIWTAMSYDPALGLLYIPVSSPSPNYWGGNRTKPIPLGTSTTALDINTGKVVWSRQWVLHDLWDYDINSAQTLMDITVDGKPVAALVQATKMGFLFTVDRRTGEDVWPIEERPVPKGDADGEVYSPTQPFPTKPAPLLDQSKKPAIWKIADIVGFGQYAQQYADGRQLPWPLLAFSPRARELSLYLMDGVSGQQALLATLGPHRTGKCCLYIRRLSDVSMPALRQLLEASVQALAPLRIR